MIKPGDIFVVRHHDYIYYVYTEDRAGLWVDKGDTLFCISSAHNCGYKKECYVGYTFILSRDQEYMMIIKMNVSFAHNIKNTFVQVV